jgi:hypothetical protein
MVFLNPCVVGNLLCAHQNQLTGQKSGFLNHHQDHDEGVPGLCQGSVYQCDHFIRKSRLFLVSVVP